MIIFCSYLEVNLYLQVMILEEKEVHESSTENAMSI